MSIMKRLYTARQQGHSESAEWSGPLRPLGAGILDALSLDVAREDCDPALLAKVLEVKWFVLNGNSIERIAWCLRADAELVRKVVAYVLCHELAPVESAHFRRMIIERSGETLVPAVVKFWDWR
jgi:hypothetical protein